MSDLERELRAMLDDRADRVESDLAGPELRRLAARRAAVGRSRVRRAAPVVASAAAVAALGIGAALLAAPGDPPPPVEPAGPRPVTSAPATPSRPPSPPVSARPVSPSVSAPLGRILASPTDVPTQRRNSPIQTLLTPDREQSSRPRLPTAATSPVSTGR